MSLKLRESSIQGDLYSAGDGLEGLVQRCVDCDLWLPVELWQAHMGPDERHSTAHPPMWMERRRLAVRKLVAAQKAIEDERALMAEVEKLRPEGPGREAERARHAVRMLALERDVNEAYERLGRKGPFD